jgi:hypothetical protein
MHLDRVETEQVHQEAQEIVQVAMAAQATMEDL